MNAEATASIRELGVFVAALIGMWVVNDARTRGKAPGAAYLWGLGVMMMMIVFLPLWLLFRPKAPASNRTGQPQAPAPFNPADPPIPDPEDEKRSRVCGKCGMFYLGRHEKCPHCGAPTGT